jgi:two-component system chemotaxis response regulator CheB
MIRVVIVEDSPVVQEFLVHILSSDPEIQVIGTASNGEEALEIVRERKPDVITMDLHMPKMNGVDATRRIMETHPTPIVIVSGSSNTSEMSTSFHAMEAGALAVVERPRGIGHLDHGVGATELLKTVKLMAEVKVVRRWASARRAAMAPPANVRNNVVPERMRSEVKIIAIGASTGGPLAVETILSGLREHLHVPVVVVQHMAAGFTRGFVDWLSHACGLPVQIAKQGEAILAGHVYVAPDHAHMTVRSVDTIWLIGDETENGHCPAVSRLFRSIANVYGATAIGVLLSGMGTDGAAELKLMKDKGALTIVQDKESSVVHGMPGEAIKLDAANYVLSPDEIAAALRCLVSERKRVL